MYYDLTYSAPKAVSLLATHVSRSKVIPKNTVVANLRTGMLGEEQDDRQSQTIVRVGLGGLDSGWRLNER